MTFSERHWCPNCGIERTGDTLTRACGCMTWPARVERERNLRAEKLQRILYTMKIRQAQIDAFEGIFR